MKYLICENISESGNVYYTLKTKKFLFYRTEKRVAFCMMDGAVSTPIKFKTYQEALFFFTNKYKKPKL